MTTFFDEQWLRDYLAKNPHLVARMAQDATSGAARSPTPLTPEVPLGGTEGPADEPEGVLLGKIRRCALENGFLFYHTYDSRGSDVGYLDCTLTKPGHPLFIWELKDRRRKPTMEQLRWLAFLPQATGVEAALYRPADWPTIEALLRRSTS